MVTVLFLIAFIIMALVLFIWFNLPKVGSRGKNEKLSDRLTREGDNCYIRKQFMTNNERRFYRELMNLVGNDNHIMVQVRLADVIKPETKHHPKSKEYLSLFRRISQWHCDFVALDKESLDVKYVIELDDSTHKRLKRIERDEFFNKALKQAGINLYRVYNIDEFKKTLERKQYH